MSLNIKVAEKWAKELENHPEKLGAVNRLFDGDHFCVWGVLTDLYAKENNIQWEENMHGFSILGWAGHAPVEVSQWIGGYGDIISKDGKTIMSLYEVDHYTGPQLAEVIREAIKKEEESGTDNDGI